MRLAILIAFLACPAAAQDAARVSEGAGLFQDFCAACHGVEARGDGPMTEVLSVEIPDLTRLSTGGAFPHFDVAAKIDGRDPVLSHGGAMPVWGSVFEGGESAFIRTESGQPIVTSEPIAALVAWLESVQD